MDLHETYHQETVRLPAVLLGVASAAIGFAFHETADRELAWSLSPALVAVLCWAGSFAAGILFYRAYSTGIRTNIAMNIADQARNAEWQQSAKTQFDRVNASAGRRYQAQQWLLLIGALFYLAGHVWHIAADPRPPVTPVASEKPLVPPRNLPPKGDGTSLPGERKGADLLGDHPGPVGTVPALDREGEGP